MAHPMTAPENRSTSRDSNARGLAVLGVAVVVGFLLLWQWGPSGDGTDSTSTKDSNTPVTTADLGATTTEATTTTVPGGSEHEPSEVSVIVLNGSGQTGAAGTTSTTVEASGYTMLEPGNAPANIEQTTVYYAPDYQADAIAIAGLLGKGTDVVKPLSDASLGGAEADADVVVVLGADTPPVSSTTTTTP